MVLGHLEEDVTDDTTDLRAALGQLRVDAVGDVLQVVPLPKVLAVEQQKQLPNEVRVDQLLLRLNIDVVVGDLAHQSAAAAAVALRRATSQSTPSKHPAQQCISRQEEQSDTECSSRSRYSSYSSSYNSCSSYSSKRNCSSRVPREAAARTPAPDESTAGP